MHGTILLCTPLHQEVAICRVREFAPTGLDQVCISPSHTLLQFWSFFRFFLNHRAASFTFITDCFSLAFFYSLVIICSLVRSKIFSSRVAERVCAPVSVLVLVQAR